MKYSDDESVEASVEHHKPTQAVKPGQVKVSVQEAELACHVLRPAARGEEKKEAEDDDCGEEEVALYLAVDDVLQCKSAHAHDPKHAISDVQQAGEPFAPTDKTPAFTKRTHGSMISFFFDQSTGVVRDCRAQNKVGRR